jgi:hypothetical protein
MVGRLEVAMAFNKAYSRPEKEEIRLQLLASMLANSNSSYSKKAAGNWHCFWQDLFKRDKIIL